MVHDCCTRGTYGSLELVELDTDNFFFEFLGDRFFFIIIDGERFFLCEYCTLFSGIIDGYWNERMTISIWMVDVWG